MSRIQLQNDQMDEQKILEEIYRKIEPGKAAPKPGSLYAKGPEIAQHPREIEAKISLEQERIAKEFGKSLEILSSREKVVNDIVLVDGEGKLKRQILQAGSISRNSKFWDPLTICYVNIQAKTESGFVFIDEMVEEYSFVLGRANEAKGLELAVARMNLGERSMIYCQPEYGYMSSKRPQNISKDDVLIFDVCLLRTEKDSPYWEMSSDQLIQKAENLKQIGNDLFSQSKYRSAFLQYDRALGLFSVAPNMPRGNSLELSLFLNCSMCKLKLLDFAEVIHLCEKALLIDSDNVKAKFRMASANKGLGEYEKSLDILRDLLSDPSVQKDSKQLRSIKKEVAEVRRLKKEQFNAEKKMFGGFMKFVDRLYDTEEYSYEDLVFDGSHEEVSRSCCHRLMTWLRQIYEKPFGKRKITLNKRKEKIL